MPNLKNNEFQIISDMLFELYQANGVKDLETIFLTNIRTLIPYTQSNFRSIDPVTNEPFKEKAVFIDTDPKMIPVFFDSITPEHNYLKNLFNYKDSLVYVETDILDDDIRKRTEFYRNFLKPQNISYGCGLVLIYEERLVGVVSLFRNEEWGDFTEKEVFILDILKKHLAQRVMDCLSTKSDNIEFSDDRLTKREEEIVKLILQDYHNDEIAEELCITVSTAKKHINNIFKKYNVNSRMDLRKLLKSR